MHRLAKSYCLLYLLFASASNAWAAEGSILSFEGDVQVNGQPATADTPVNREDAIVTAGGASVKIVLSDNSVLDLDSDSEIQLSDYSYSPSEPQQNNSEIKVVQGTLRYISGLIVKEDPSKLSFSAGNSAIGVRGGFTEINVDGGTVNVKAMIGETTMTHDVEGEEDTVIVPAGYATQKDPTTGEILLTTSAAVNKVDAAVRAIVASAPDPSTAKPTDEGCSESGRPLRTAARPAYDAESATAIENQLAALSQGELMMVTAVLVNNAGQLCIDKSTVAAAIRMIASVNPDVTSDVIFVAILLDPDNAGTLDEEFGPLGAPLSVPQPETEIPTGGGNPASPE